MSSPDPDLSDVFRLLYQDDPEDAWASFSDDEEDTPILPVTADADVETVEGDLSLVEDTSKRYTSKRFLDELDSLFTPSHPKKARIYEVPNRRSAGVLTSTTPLPPLPPIETYAPFSPLALLARLRSFLPATYPPLAAPLDPQSLALGGWTNAGRDALACAQCKAQWSVKGVVDVKEDRVRVEVIRRLAAGSRLRHADTCPWRITASPVSLVNKIRSTLHPAITSSIATLAERLEAECLEHGDISWSSPLSTDQLANLQRHVTRQVRLASETAVISFTAVALAFFGWYPYQANDPDTSSHITPDNPPHRTEIVACRICQRRVGLWAFKAGLHAGDAHRGEQRVLDVRGEHLGWCPIRSEPWWEGCDLLKEKEKGDLAAKDWLRVSEKLEKKPWRRVRATLQQ